jgi:hypothetical protein
MQFKTQLRFWLFVISLLGFEFSQAQYAGSGKPARVYTHSYGHTGTLLDGAIYYAQTEATASPAAGNTWQNTTSLYDIKLGQVLESSIYVGLEYSTRSDNQISNATTSGNSVGAGVGYFTENGFNIRAYYKFNENYGDYKDGTGFEADLGYMVNMTSNFYLGINLSVRQITFKTNSTITNFDYWTRKETYPFLALGFLIN